MNPGDMEFLATITVHVLSGLIETTVVWHICFRQQ